MGDDVKIFEEEFPEIFAGVTGVVEAKLKEREVDTDAVIERKLREREFAKALSATCPSWRETWKTPEFQAFLGEVDEDSISGLTNYAFVADAFRRLDSGAVIRFFKFFSEGRPKRKDSRGSSQSGRIMSVETARKKLKELASERARGLWRNREKDYQAESNRLVKLITGQGE